MKTFTFEAVRTVSFNQKITFEVSCEDFTSSDTAYRIAQDKLNSGAFKNGDWMRTAPDNFSAASLVLIK